MPAELVTGPSDM